MAALLHLIISILFVFLPPCEYEDSPNCSWDAGSAGNGVGNSFVNLDGTYYYLNGDTAQPGE